MLASERANEPFGYEPGIPVGKVTAGNNGFHAGTAPGCPGPDGYLRVHMDKRGAKRHCAEIRVNGVKKFPGYFDTLDEAARREAGPEYGFHSNRGTNKAAYVKKR